MGDGGRRREIEGERREGREEETNETKHGQ